MIEVFHNFIIIMNHGGFFYKLWFTYGNMIAINQKLLLFQAFCFFKELFFIDDRKAEIQVVLKYTISSKQSLCFYLVLCFKKAF